MHMYVATSFVKIVERKSRPNLDNRVYREGRGRGTNWVKRKDGEEGTEWMGRALNIFSKLRV